MLAAIAGAFGASCVASGSPRVPAVPDRAGDSLHAMLQALRDSTRAPALSIAIARDGRVLLSYADGLADVARRVPASPHTVYRIGSLSKLLTAATAARLAERSDRALDWDADVRRYVPELPPKRGTITLRQLAGHLAGIRHYGPSEFVNHVHYDSVAPSIAAFRDDTLLFAPGTRYFYSSFGYVLLSLAIERAAQTPFLALVHREVLARLGMKETGPDRPDSAIAMRAIPYDLGADGAIERAPDDDLSNRWAAGGFLSSVMDLARFGSAFLRTGFLRDSTIRMMTTPQRLSTGAESPVGIGWRIGKDAAGRRIWHHAGSSLGGRAILVVWPDDGIVVAIAGNLLFNQGERSAFRFADLVR